MILVLYQEHYLCSRQKIKCSNFVIVAKAGSHAGSGKKPLEEMDSRIREKTMTFLLCTEEHYVGVIFLKRIIETLLRYYLSPVE